MHRINIILAFCIAVLGLGLSTRSNAQVPINWGWDGTYVVDKSFFATPVGGYGTYFDPHQPRAYAASAARDEVSHALGVYHVMCTWQGSGLPGPFIYGGVAGISGQSKNPYQGYPGSVPGSGSSSSSVGSMTDSCPANYSDPFLSEVTVPNKDKNNKIDMQFQVEAKASGNSCTTLATATVTPR